MVEEEIRKKLDEISANMRKDYSEMLRDLNLHVGQDHLLCRLGEKDGVTQIQLSESLKCEPPTIVHKVRALESYGLIHRQRDELDGRVNRVYLTPKGRAILEPIEEVWTRQQDKLLTGMSADELLTLKKLLKKMAENIS